MDGEPLETYYASKDGQLMAFDGELSGQIGQAGKDKVSVRRLAERLNQGALLNLVTIALSHIKVSEPEQAQELASEAVTIIRRVIGHRLTHYPEVTTFNSCGPIILQYSKGSESKECLVMVDARLAKECAKLLNRSNYFWALYEVLKSFARGAVESAHPGMAPIQRL